MIEKMMHANTITAPPDKLRICAFLRAVPVGAIERPGACSQRRSYCEQPIARQRGMSMKRSGMRMSAPRKTGSCHLPYTAIPSRQIPSCRGLRLPVDESVFIKQISSPVSFSVINQIPIFISPFFSKIFIIILLYHYLRKKYMARQANIASCQ